MKLSEICPEIEQLRAASLPQLGHDVLRAMLNDIPPAQARRAGVSAMQPLHLHPQNISLDGYGNHQREAELLALQAWAWMESQAILIRTDRHQNSFGWATLSPIGADFYESRDCTKLFAAARLSKNALHPALREEPLECFWRGQFELGIVAAMRLVEIRVRDASQLAAEDVGADLMRKAFKPKGGPLTDMAVPFAERESVAHLFAGTYGLFRNSHSHRFVKADADTCADVLILASMLLRMIDSRVAAN